MDTATARKRLEETRDELDRSIMVLRGTGRWTSGRRSTRRTRPTPGANLSETERVEAVLAVAKQQRSEVLDALHRIELGTYGTCVDCGERVPEGRLEAKPEAARCVACQGKRDRLRR